MWLNIMNIIYWTRRNVLNQTEGIEPDTMYWNQTTYHIMNVNDFRQDKLNQTECTETRQRIIWMWMESDRMYWTRQNGLNQAECTESDRQRSYKLWECRPIHRMNDFYIYASWSWKANAWKNLRILRCGTHKGTGSSVVTLHTTLPRTTFSWLRPGERADSRVGFSVTVLPDGLV